MESKSKGDIFFQMHANHYTALTSQIQCRPFAEICFLIPCVKASYALSNANTLKKNDPKIRMLGRNFKNLDELGFLTIVRLNLSEGTMICGYLPVVA